jgi:hypothetical protein
MTTPTNPPPQRPLVVEPPTPVRAPRHALGLPAGSIRALLTLMVLGLIWTLMLLPEDRKVGIPLYLFYLMFLILGHFFAAHGHSIAGPTTGPGHPLYLPRGTLRTLIVVGFLAVFGYRYYVTRDWQTLLQLNPPVPEQLMEQPYLPLVLIIAFFIGVLAARLFHRPTPLQPGGAPWVQDIEAWVALLATLGLAAEIIIQVVINPSMSPDRQLNLPNWQMALAAVICFYFGVRS